MSNHSNSIPASYAGALLTQPIFSGGAQYDEQRKAYEMSRHLQELTSENTRLRNSIIDANDEVFSLRACMASVELEAKYNAEQELLHMQSELTFKNKELSSLNKDYQKLLKELSALKQTKTGAAPTIKTEQLPADFAEHSRAADAPADTDATVDRTVAMTPPLDNSIIDHGATISGQQGDHDNNCNSLPEAPAAPRDDDADDAATATAAAMCDTSDESQALLSAAHIAGSSSSRSSVPERERLVPPSPAASVSTISYISFLFQTYSSAVQQQQNSSSSSPRKRSPSDVQRETTRCELLRDVAREVKALSDQALDPRTCNSSSSIIDWSSLERKVLRLCRHMSLLDPRRVEPTGLQLLDAVFCAGPLQQQQQQQGLGSRVEELAVGVANRSHSRVVAALQIPMLSSAWQLSSKGSTTVVVDSSSSSSSCSSTSSCKDYLLYLEDMLHRLCVREERRPMMGVKTTEADAALSRRAVELTVSSIVNFFSARIYSNGCEGMVEGSSSSSYEEEELLQLLEMLFDRSRGGAAAAAAAYGRLEASCSVSSRGTVLFIAFAPEHSSSLYSSSLLLLSAGLKIRLLRLCGCVLKNQRLFRLFASNQRYSKHQASSVPLVKEEMDVPDQRSSSSVHTASSLSGRTSQSPSFLFDAIHSLLDASKDNNFCSNSSSSSSSASVEQLQLKVQTVEFLLRLLFSRGSEFVQLMLGMQLSSAREVDNNNNNNNNRVDNSCPSTTVDMGSSLRKRRADTQLQREAKTLTSPRATLESSAATCSLIPLAGEQTIQPSSSSLSSCGGGGAAVTRQVGAISSSSSSPVRVEIDASSTTDCRLVCMLAEYWMHLIRSLDVCSALCQVRGTATQQKTVLVQQLISRLHCLLTGLLDYLSPADCDFILSDVADLFHEYIYRWNTSSWLSGDLRRMMMDADSMFKFLEVNRPLQE